MDVSEVRTATPRRVGWLAGMDWPRALVLGVLLVVTGLLVAWPLLRLLGESVAGPAGLTLAYYLEFLGHPDLLETAWNTVVVAAGTTLMSGLIGVSMAWAVSRTTMPLRGMIRSLVTLTFSAPSFLGALAWVLLLGPRAGKLNVFLMDLFGLEKAPFDIFSPGGIIFVLTMFSFPLVFMPVAAALDNMDASLEDASRMLGASRWRTTAEVTVPLVVPAILSGSILVFIEAMVVFGPVAVLGMPVQYYTLATKMITLLRDPPRLELAAVLALPVILVLLALQVLQRKWLGRRRYTVMTGKVQRARPVDLGLPARWGLSAICLAVVFVSVVLPFGMLLQVSITKSLSRGLTWANLTLTDNYRYLFEQDVTLRALGHSLLLSAGAVLVALILSLLAAWMTERTATRGRGVLGLLFLTPYAFPGSALGIALILAFGGPPFRLAGTLTIMLIAYVIRVLPISFSYTRSGLLQVSPELEQAARMSGAGWLQSLRDVTLPLMRGGLLAAGMVQFVLLFRELGVSVFLYTGGNEVAAVAIYDFAQEAQFALMAALSMIVAVVNLVVVTAVHRWWGGGRFTSAS